MEHFKRSNAQTNVLQKLNFMGSKTTDAKNKLSNCLCVIAFSIFLSFGTAHPYWTTSTMYLTPTCCDASVYSSSGYILLQSALYYYFALYLHWHRCPIFDFCSVLPGVL